MTVIPVGQQGEKSWALITAGNQGSPVGQPGEQLSFTNRATGEAVAVTLDAQGFFPPSVLVAAPPGAELEVERIDSSSGNSAPLGLIRVAGEEDLSATPQKVPMGTPSWSVCHPQHPG